MSGSDNTFPFRRQTGMDPLVIPITGPNDALQPVSVDKQALNLLGVKSFKWFNPTTKMGIWLRGWNEGDNPPVVYKKGHYLPPMGGEVNTSQIPDYLAVVADDTPDHPTMNNNTFLYPGRSAYLIYGGGI